LLTWCSVSVCWRPGIDLTLFARHLPAVVVAVSSSVAPGALPFLLPLLMQLGFGITPFQVRPHHVCRRLSRQI